MNGYITLTCADPRCVDPAAGHLHRIDMHSDLDVNDVLARYEWTRDGLDGPVYCARHRHTIPTQRQGDRDG